MKEIPIIIESGYSKYFVFQITSDGNIEQLKNEKKILSPIVPNKESDSGNQQLIAFRLNENNIIPPTDGSTSNDEWWLLRMQNNEIGNIPIATPPGALPNNVDFFKTERPINDWIDPQVRYLGTNDIFPNWTEAHNGTHNDAEQIRTRANTIDMGANSRYIFGFYRALVPPIQIKIEEYTGVNITNGEEVNIRLGALLPVDNDDHGNVLSNFYSTSKKTGAVFSNLRIDNRALTNELNANFFKFRPGAEMLEIRGISNKFKQTASDGTMNSKIHWLQLQDIPATNISGGPDVQLYIRAGRGNPFPIHATVNLLLIIDASGSTFYGDDDDVATNGGKRTIILKSLRALEEELKKQPNLIVNFAIRVLGATGKWSTGSFLEDTANDPKYSSSTHYPFTANSVTSTTNLMTFKEGISSMNEVVARVKKLLDVEISGSTSDETYTEGSKKLGYSPIWRALYESGNDFNDLYALKEAEIKFEDLLLKLNSDTGKVKVKELLIAKDVSLGTIINDYSAGSTPSPAIKKKLLNGMNALISDPAFFIGNETDFMSLTTLRTRDEYNLNSYARLPGKLNRFLLEDIFFNEIIAYKKIPHAIALIGDGDDTVGGYIGSKPDGADIVLKTRGEAKIEVEAERTALESIDTSILDDNRKDRLAALQDLDKLDNHIADLIRNDANAKLNSTTDNDFKLAMQGLKSKLGITGTNELGKFVIVRTEEESLRMVPDPVSDWFQGLAIDFEIDDLMVNLFMNDRWCH